MDERLQQLLTKTQRYAPQSQEWQSALMRLVDEILRSQSVRGAQSLNLCRLLPNQSLFGDGRENCEQIRQQLWDDVA